MFDLYLLVTSSLVIVYVDVISNIQCYLYKSKKQFYKDKREMTRNIANKYAIIFGTSLQCGA